MERIDDESLKALIDSEIDAAIGADTGELSTDRSEAMDRYLGEPLGTEMEGRSHVQTRDVMDVIEWILPSLIRIFIDNEGAVRVAPTGPEDEETAEQESDYLNYLFFQKNEGFLILYTWFKDALLQKNGILKSFPEEHDDTKREEYNDITDIELLSLLQDDDVEVVEFTEKEIENDAGGPVQVSDVVILRHDNDTRIIVENLPVEEFLISKDARSVNPKKARFTAHVTEITVSDLKEAGFTDKQIQEMEDGDSTPTTQEEIARNNLSDENFVDTALINEAMRTKKVYECYVRADRNGDGIAELLKVTRSGNFIDAEEVDRNPFAAITPIILTHKFYGLGVADIIKDLQEIRTALMRAYLDNSNQLINGTTYYNENTVNIDDMLTSKPFGIRAVDGSPAGEVLHIPPSGLPPQAFSLFELTDQLKTSRIGDFQGQIDPSVMEKANTGVVIRLIQEAKAKTEMIARIFAETGVKQLFRDLHELARKYSDREDVIRLRGQWLPVNPQEWRERTDFRITVGLGHKTREERLADLNDIMNLQQRLVDAGGMGTLVNPMNIHEATKDYIEELGYPNADKYLMDPRQAQPQPPPPDPNLLLIQQQERAAEMKRMTEQEQNQIKAAEVQGNQVLKQLEQQTKAEVEAGKQQIAAMNTQINELKAMAQIQNDQVKVALTEKSINLEQQVKEIQTLLDHKETEQAQQIDTYKAELNAQINLLIAEMKNATPKQDQTMQLVNSLTDQIDKIHQSLEEITGPKEIQRDGKGRIIAIGNRKIKRDISGRATGIE